MTVKFVLLEFHGLPCDPQPEYYQDSLSKYEKNWNIREGNQNGSAHYLSRALCFHLNFGLHKDSRVTLLNLQYILYQPCSPHLVHYIIPHPFYLQPAWNVPSGVRKNTGVGSLHFLENFMHFPPSRFEMNYNLMV